ncbi:MAG: TonB family protein [Bryobacteraceae bacterium]|jgi:TonB family protein
MRVLLAGPDFEENLSIRYLSASLLGAGHETILAPFNTAADIPDVAGAAHYADVVGLSICFQARAQEFLDLARRIKSREPRKLIVAGGHYASCAAEPLLAHYPEIDIIVIHEGERTLVEIADAAPYLEDHLPEISGIAYRHGGHVLFTNPRRITDNLDALPFPDRRGPVHTIAGVPTSYLMGSRGCFGHCAYCCITTLHRMAPGKRFRQRELERIADEMAFLYLERGTRQFVFHDDNFLVPSEAVNHARVTAFETALKERGVENIALVLKGRPADATPSMLRRLKDLGLVRIFLGVEASTTRGLSVLERKQSVEDSERALEACAELGISAQFTLMVFNPDATLDTLRSDVAFLRRYSGNPLNFCRTEIYTGTPLEQRMIDAGRARGNYLARVYSLLDPAADLACEISLDLFAARCWSNASLMQNAIGLDHTAAVLKRFYKGSQAEGLARRVAIWLRAANSDTIDLLDEVIELSASAGSRDAGFARAVRALAERESATRQHFLAEAAGLRAELDTGRAAPSARPTTQVPQPWLRLAKHAAAAVIAIGLPVAGCSEHAPPPLTSGAPAPRAGGPEKPSSSLFGKITDATGAAVPNAKIRITDMATGEVRTLTANPAGEYTARDLSAGPYTVRVEEPSLGTAEHTGIALGAGASERVDLRLMPFSGCCEYAAPPLKPTPSPTSTPGQEKPSSSLFGTVMDPTEAVIPNAKIRITNVDTGALLNLTTNEKGEYATSGLSAGRYTLKAESPGFQSAEKTGIVLQAGARQRVDFRLNVAMGCCEYAAVALKVTPDPNQQETPTPAATPEKPTCSLFGTVTDPAWAVVPGAKIGITNLDTGAVRALTTGYKGEYSANDLAPGRYTLKVEAPGFNTAEKAGIVLQAGSRDSASLQLTLARVDVRLTVNSDVSSVGCCEYAAVPLDIEDLLRHQKKPFQYVVGEAKDHGTLQGIAWLVYGDSRAWIQIFEANRGVIKKPGPVLSGTSLLIPPRKRLVPKLVHRVLPAYPPAAREQHVRGDVVLDVTLSDDGAVEQAGLIDGNPLLAEAATNAVKQWKYKPLLVGGKPVLKFVVVLSFGKRGKVRAI